MTDGLDRHRHDVYLYSVTGDEFKRLRLSIKYSQAKLAKEMDITIRTLTRWETGEYPVSRMGELAIETIVRRAKRKEEKKNG
jgi:transcriptional regulator with XRE-family HTH domain